MLIREKDGKYAGQIRDFPPEVARNLLATGRGEDPYAEKPIAPVVPAVVAGDVAQATRPGKRGGRK